MRKWTYALIEILNGFFVFSSLYFMVVSQVYGDNLEACLRAFVFIPIMMVIAAGAHRAKNFWLYLISVGIAIIMAYAAADTMVQKVLMIVFTVCIALSYFLARSKKRNCWLEKPEFALLALYLGLYWLAGSVDSQFLRIYACYSAGFYYLLINYYTNTVQISNFVNTHSRLERFPERRLVKSNRRMMWMQSGVVMAGMFVAPFVGIDQIIYGIGRVLRNILAYLLSGLDQESIPEKVQKTEKEKEMMLIGEEKILPEWIEVLYFLMDVLSWILVIGFLLFALYKIVKILYGMYLAFGVQTEENGDQVERIFAVSSEESKMHMKKSKKENLFWNLSPNAKIRKFYKKRVKKDMKETINPAWTPQEIEQFVKLPMQEKQLLHSLYEKARYSQAGCSKEEAQEVWKIP